MVMNNKSKSKRSSTSGNGIGGSKKRAKSLNLARFDNDNDEHIDSSDDDDDAVPTHARHRDDESDNESEEENLDVKKVRLAREYLQQIETVPSDDDDRDNDEEDNDESSRPYDTISRRLQRERLLRQGALKKDYAQELTLSLQSIQEHIQSLSLSCASISSATRTVAPAAAAASKDWMQAGYITLLKHHDLTPTCVALTGDSRYAVSGAKDHSAVVWDLHQQVVVSTLCPHWKDATTTAKTKNHRTSGQVLSVACSDDGHFVAVGKRDATVSIYDLRIAAGAVQTTTTTVPATPTQPRMTPLKQFTGHKGAVTGLAFRSQSHQLFTASEDRCIRHYSLDEMLYMETLYGHQFGITDIDCHLQEQPISVGRDRTARAWKLASDSHLIFRGGAQVPAADTVTCLNEHWFLTGHENGLLCLWTMDKKRPMATIERTHGALVTNTDHNDDAAAAMIPGSGRGVVSISSIKGSDVAATGSNDGYLRLWKVQTGRQASERGLERLSEIPVPGFINDICFSNPNHESGKKLFCVAAIGQEHRLGRWERVPRAKNRIAIIQLQPSEQEQSIAAIDEDTNEVDEDHSD
jgi:ribosomal RNA-processing protein 9